MSYGSPCYMVIHDQAIDQVEVPGGRTVGHDHRVHEGVWPADVSVALYENR